MNTKAVSAVVESIRTRQGHIHYYKVICPVRLCCYFSIRLDTVSRIFSDCIIKSVTLFDGTALTNGIYVPICVLYYIMYTAQKNLRSTWF